MRDVFTPSANGDWSPALPGLQRLRLDLLVVVQAVVTILMVGMIWTAKGAVAVWMLWWVVARRRA